MGGLYGGNWEDSQYNWEDTWTITGNFGSHESVHYVISKLQTSYYTLHYNSYRSSAGVEHDLAASKVHLRQYMYGMGCYLIMLYSSPVGDLTHGYLATPDTFHCINTLSRKENC